MTPDLPAPKSPLVPPAGLGRAEKAEWKRHAEWVRSLGLESGVDAGQFEAMVRHLIRARRCERKGEASLAIHSWRAYCLQADKFGLSATARAKLGTQPQKPEEAGDVPPELRDASGG
jgi:hypothetical protein